MHDAVAILGMARTPIGRFGGKLKDVPAIDLGATAAQCAIERSGVEPVQIERLVAGENIQVTPRGNPARQVLLKSGLPVTASDYAVNMNCASGLRAMTCLAGDLLLGDVEFGVAVGMENMSRTPYLVEKLRWGGRLGNIDAVDFLADYILGDAGPMAEKVARSYRISRDRQDAFAVESQRRAQAAITGGLFASDIVSVDVGDGVSQDEHPRPDVTAEALGRLAPAFSADGTVTAGNSSGINDGAAAVVLTGLSTAEQRGLRPRAILRDWVSAGVDPTMFGIGPVPAVMELLRRNGLRMADIDLVELNEAFASSTLAVMEDLDLDPERTNVNGGAIALGHPVGATGLVLAIKLVAELERTKQRYAIATMCVGNGQGMAVLLESLAARS
ncbi:MAG: thiolase family protein [Chloroflexota bacterium]